MDIFVKVPHYEDLVIVPDWLAPEELFWLAEGGFVFDDLVGLGVEDKAVRDPAIVATKDHDL